MVKIRSQVKELRVDRFTMRPLKDLIACSEYLRLQVKSPLKTCQGCKQKLSRNVLCFPSEAIEFNSIDILLSIFNSNLGYTGSNFTLYEIFSVIKHFLFNELCIPCFLDI